MSDKSVADVLEEVMEICARDVGGKRSALEGHFGDREVLEGLQVHAAQAGVDIHRLVLTVSNYPVQMRREVHWKSLPKDLRYEEIDFLGTEGGEVLRVGLRDNGEDYYGVERYASKDEAVAASVYPDHSEWKETFFQPSSRSARDLARVASGYAIASELSAAKINSDTVSSPSRRAKARL